MMLSTMTMNTITDPAIAQSAKEMLDRYGDDAAEHAAVRAAGFARDGRWLEHDLALRLLTAIEEMGERR